MKQYQEIEILLERFMEVRTSLGEEARLSEFFRQTPDLPSEWEPYREMFAYFDSGMPDVEAATPRPVPVWYRRRKVVTWLAAACLAVCMVSMWWWVSRPEASEAPMLSLVEPAAGAPDSVKAKKAAPRAETEAERVLMQLKMGRAVRRVPKHYYAEAQEVAEPEVPQVSIPTTPQQTMPTAYVEPEDDHLQASRVSLLAHSTEASPAVTEPTREEILAAIIEEQTKRVALIQTFKEMIVEDHLSYIEEE